MSTSTANTQTTGANNSATTGSQTGTSTGANTNASQVNPWGPQQAALTAAFGNAQTAYGQASQAVAPTNFTAAMTPEQIASYQQMVSQGSNLAVPNQQAATGSALSSAGTSGVQSALSGLSSYNPSATNNANTVSNAAQQYVNSQNIPAQVANDMLPALQQAQQVTMPGIEQNAAIGGNTNSTRTGIADGLVQQGLAEQQQNLTGSLEGTANANAEQLAQTQANNNNTNSLGALNSAGTIGNSAANAGTVAGTASVANQGALSNEAAAGGAGLTAAQQAILTNQEQQFQSATTSPYAALNGLMPIIGGTNWGSSTTGSNTSAGTSANNLTSNTNGTTSGTSNTQSTPSALSTIAGLLSGGGALLGSGGGTNANGSTSNGSGLLGLSNMFSDRRIKRDITRIGTLDNGLPLYTFVYIGDPEARLNVGLMAQDVEKVNPEAVVEIDGIKRVNYAMACA